MEHHNPIIGIADDVDSIRNLMNMNYDIKR